MNAAIAITPNAPPENVVPGAVGIERGIARCAVMGPLITAPMLQAISGSWIDRSTTVTSSQFRLHAYGLVYDSSRAMSDISSGALSGSRSSSGLR